MSAKPPSNLKAFESLISVMELLASPNGCPWDREQTHESLIPYLIEESHEVVEAIEKNNMEGLKDELGDLLLQIVFHAELARKAGHFDMSDVIENINSKMIRRHPHVFADGTANTADEVKINWEKIKKSERQGAEEALLGGPVGSPSLQRSHKIGEKTKRQAFDWKDTKGVQEKLEEELSELKDAIEHNDPTEIEHELGDTLFTLAQLARHLKLNGETALRKANRRFEQRFFAMKELAISKGLDWATLDDGSKELLWEEIKSRPL